MTQPIDFTKPIEHVDGTPLVLREPWEQSPPGNPDAMGDWYLKREDGKPFTPEQGSAWSSYYLIVRPDGTKWGFDLQALIIRNRQPQPSRIPDDVVERMVRAIKSYAAGDLVGARLNGRTAHAEMLDLASALPELPVPVDPDLIEARKWCIDRANDIGLGEASERVMRGDGDDLATVRDYLAGIKRGRELAANEKGEG